MADKKKTLYHLVSTARSVRTRTVRANNPTHSGLKQFIAGTYRLIRNRPLVFTEEMLRKHLDEIKQKNAIGMLEVRTPDGRLVHLDTLEPMSATPSPPKPVFRQDSIANDDAWGEKVEGVPAGVPLQDVVEETEEDIENESEEEESAEDKTAKSSAKKVARRRRRRAT